MKKLFFILSLIYCISSNGQVKTDEKLSESKIIAIGQPKLVKNLGSLNDKGNNVHCSLQDKVGNLWFGTTGDGLFKYDGKSFTRFTTKDGLINNSIWSILEDRTGVLWVGTRETILHRFDGKRFTSYTENKMKWLD
jgi:ligand-binding sensor domain-containing protein